MSSINYCLSSGSPGFSHLTVFVVHLLGLLDVPSTLVHLEFEQKLADGRLAYSHDLAPVHADQEVRLPILACDLLDVEEVLPSLQHDLHDDEPGLAVGLLPLHGGWTEHLQPLDPGQDHGQPVGVLDVLDVCPRVTKYITNPGLQTQMEAHTLGSTLLVTAANAGEHTVVGVSRPVGSDLVTTQWTRQLWWIVASIEQLARTMAEQLVEANLKS